ncbi:MAG: DUF4149 domain-containing protein [Gemmatimonadota bacterium]
MRLTVLVWLWLGAALLFIAVVAPAAFSVLPTRALAGLLVGRVLPVLFWSGAFVGLVLAVGTQGWRRWAAMLLVASALGAQVGVAPRIQQLRAVLGPDLESIDVADPQRVAFGRMHALSVALLGVGMLGASAIALGALKMDRAKSAPATSPPTSLPTSPGPTAAPHGPSGV